VALGLAVAACSSSGASSSHTATLAGSSAASTATIGTTAQAAPNVTCASLAPTMQPVVSDQKSQDASLEQNWVGLVDGTPTSQGSDLQAAVSATNGVSVSDQLSQQAQQFNTDATTFLSDQSGGLVPGWTTEYNALKADIYAMARTCGWS
jgi:hypothetical protein